MEIDSRKQSCFECGVGERGWLCSVQVCCYLLPESAGREDISITGELTPTSRQRYWYLPNFPKISRWEFLLVITSTVKLVEKISLLRDILRFP